MLPAIQLNRQPRAKAEKIDNESCDGNLATESEAFEAMLAQPGPKCFLSIGHACAQLACENLESSGVVSRNSHGRPPPQPSPGVPEEGEKRLPPPPVLRGRVGVGALV